MKTERVKTIAAIGLIALLVNTAYIAAFASPTIFYMANVLGHVVLGIVVAVVGALALARHRELRSSTGAATTILATEEHLSYPFVFADEGKNGDSGPPPSWFIDIGAVGGFPTLDHCGGYFFA